MTAEEPGQRYLEREWASFRESVMPAAAGEIQVQECRRAFYAGACSMQNLFQRVGGPDVSADDALALLQGAYEELTGFLAAVAGGRA